MGEKGTGKSITVRALASLLPAKAPSITTHRAEIFFFFAGRAFAGLLKAPFLWEKHLLFVEPLVLANRTKLPEERESPTSESTDTEKKEKEEAIPLSLQALLSLQTHWEL